MSRNVQLDLAYNFVQYTGRNIFLTGKAGTGKTTFLHHLKKTTIKRMAVVAPTGVAAINAGGVTIHSFFQLPFGPYVAHGLAANNETAGSGNQRYQKFNRDKINVIRSLDLLVIDEISMVRADTLDGIDEILRRYKDPRKPFGGVQLLMIGDLHQLSPVVKDDDWQILKDIYPNLFFFSSKALQKTDPVNIELRHIYRQSDNFFIDLLNSIRENKMTTETLTQLNSRFIPGFKPAQEEGYITLTTHNRTAQEINEARLRELPGNTKVFTADVSGEFPEYSYPTVRELELKEGAQVMFVKNDPSKEKLFYNGKIGTVTRLEKETIYVKCPGDPMELAVMAAEWQNIRYDLNKETREVEEKVAGIFTQVPLRLAWAITIHKSQGLTFEKAIIDAGASFAHGQVYVALSRCKSFEGVVLRSPIAFDSVKTDSTVAGYNRNAEENQPDDRHLHASKVNYQQGLLHELFDFTTLRIRLSHFLKLAQDNFASLPPGLANDLEQIMTTAGKSVYPVADTFKKQLSQLILEHGSPEDSETIQDRIKRACEYFHGRIDELLYRPLKSCAYDSDNKAVKKLIDEAFENTCKELFIKLEVLNACKTQFNTIAYLRTKGDAAIDFQNKKTFVIEGKEPNSKHNIKHNQLFEMLKKWRNDLAAENNSPAYHIVPQKALLELVNTLPADLDQLLTVKGIGKIKARAYGEDIIGIINVYCRNNDIERASLPATASAKTDKADTKSISMNMYREGKNIAEIAAERGFAISTIEGHLTHFIGSEEFDIHQLVSKEKIGNVAAYLERNEVSTLPLNDLKLAMGDDYSYGELRAIQKYLEISQNAQTAATSDITG